MNIQKKTNVIASNRHEVICAGHSNYLTDSFADALDIATEIIEEDTAATVTIGDYDREQVVATVKA